MKSIFAALAAAVLLAGSAHAQSMPEPVGSPPAGTYKLDRAHASLNFRVSHMGFSNYTARFTEMDATLDIEPADQAILVLALVWVAALAICLDWLLPSASRRTGEALD